MRHWTDETDREADVLFRTFSVAEIRRRQDLADQQITRAFAQRNEDALADLNAMRDALSREMARRTAARDFPDGPPPGIDIECCPGVWVPYPESGQPSECPQCHSAFALKDDAG